MHTYFRSLNGGVKLRGIASEVMKSSTDPDVAKAAETIHLGALQAQLSSKQAFALRSDRTKVPADEQGRRKSADGVAMHIVTEDGEHVDIEAVVRRVVQTPHEQLKGELRELIKAELREVTSALKAAGPGRVVRQIARTKALAHRAASKLPSRTQAAAGAPAADAPGASAAQAAADEERQEIREEGAASGPSRSSPFDA